MLQRFADAVLSIEVWLFMGLGFALLGMGVAQLLYGLRQEGQRERRWWVLPAVIAGYGTLLLVVSVVRLFVSSGTTTPVMVVFVLVTGFISGAILLIVGGVQWSRAIQTNKLPTYQSPALARSVAELDREVQMILLATRGNKIEAIKRVRQLTDMSLKEAKDYIDAVTHTGT